MMVVVAGIVGRRISIRPKKHDDWTVIPNLWGAIIGRPGVMKSPAIKEPMKAVQRLEIAAKERFEEAAADFEVAHLVAKAKRKAAEAELKEAIKEGDDAAAEIAREAIGSTPRPPVRQRYIVNDSSVEKLGEILCQNPRGVLVYRDELIGLLKSLEKEGQEGARAFYLEAWNGDGRFTYDRIGRGTLDIESVCISLIGSIQPGPLGGYLRQAINSGKGDDGLMQRFQLSVWPDPSKHFTNVDQWPDKAAKNAAFEVLERLNDLDPNTLGAMNDENGNGVPYLRFEDDAQPVFDEWRTNLEIRLRCDEEHPAIEAHLAKYRSLIPSLALLIHLADEGYGPVGCKALHRAIGWGKYLESHARRIFAPAALSSARGARILAKKIRDGVISDGFTLRSIYINNWSGLSTRDEAEEAVDVLIDAEWLREQKEQTGGAPKTTYRINPAILAGQYPSEAANMAASTNQHNHQNLQKPPSDGFDGFDGSQGGGCAGEMEVAEWTS
jgi:putative DNA primase/helicase